MSQAHKKRALEKTGGIFRQAQKAGEDLGGVRWFLRVRIGVAYCPISSLSEGLVTIPKNFGKVEVIFAQITYNQKIKELTWPLAQTKQNNNNKKQG